MVWSIRTVPVVWHTVLILFPPQIYNITRLERLLRVTIGAEQVGVQANAALCRDCVWVNLLSWRWRWYLNVIYSKSDA